MLFVVVMVTGYLQEASDVEPLIGGTLFPIGLLQQKQQT